MFVEVTDLAIELLMIIGKKMDHKSVPFGNKTSVFVNAAYKKSISSNFQIGLVADRCYSWKPATACGRGSMELHLRGSSRHGTLCTNAEPPGSGSAFSLYVPLRS